jgi:hypothetical protein
VDARQAEVRRLLDRYLVEIVEAYELCPWARPARLAGEIAACVLWGAPEEAVWTRAAEHALGQPHVRVAMIVAPQWAGSPAALRALRDRVAARLPHAGVADFHPAAELDLATPARLVPYLRRSPDPLLQCVPLSLLDSVRTAAPQPALATQAAMLRGLAPDPAGDMVARLAAASHARVAADPAALVARLADIAEDRARSYERVGITTCPTPSG